MADLRKHGQTSNLVRFTLKNSSTGQGLTGLDHSSSGLIISTIADVEASATAYTVAAGNVETISTLGTFAAPTSGKCRFKAVDGTNHPGLYEFQFDNGRFSVASARRLVVSVTGAANLLNADYEIRLVAFDPQDAVRMGLTALPNAAAAAADGLYTRSAIAELAQAKPSATPNLETAVMAMYMALRNRLDVEAGATNEKRIYNDAGTCVFKKTLSDDGTTYSEAEAESGP